ncbi:dienelactone hydrolase family protein [Paraburkholderia sp.]|uniref:alpha/beta hydrolase n=1 Tax=Paraburkholderia sp. TaxID=1926495 RepID=UPI0023824476|nr:dienelactone hydrolase family protein [Paraburkholderia sp.]MDE1181622.1 dienelactone hydrolase family protein [Paraburkholderia sp.]
MSWEQFEHGWRLAPATLSTGAAAKPRALVVLLHGVGSNARDLMPLADIWRETLPDAGFVSLNGSEPFDGGFDGRQWFSLRDVTPANRTGRVEAAYPALLTMLQNELAHWHLGFSELALVGFSQGSIMSLHHVATNPAGAAVVVAYSGRLASPVVAQSRTPLTLVHGEEDAVIPVQETEQAAIAFSDAGYPVEAYALPGIGHTISGDGAMLGRDALARAFSGAV